MKLIILQDLFQKLKIEMVEKDLTILIPTFNQGGFISETINSILNQTIMPNEILISNNHSTDKTDLVLAQYNNHKFIKIFKPKSHLTMTQNWNFLAKKVNTKYFSIISSDDFFEKNFVEEFMLCKSSQFGYYRFNFNRVDGHGKKIDTAILKSVPVIQKFPNNFLNQFYGPKGGFAASVYRTDLVRKVNFFSESLNFYADWNMLLDLSEQTNFYFNPKIVSNYRQNYREGITYKRAIQAGLKDHLYIFDKIKEKIINNNLSKYMYLLKFSIQVHSYEYLKILNEKDSPFTKKIKNYLKRNNIKKDEIFLSIYLKKMFLKFFELSLKFR